MTKLAEALGTPIVREFGGRAYTLSPLTLGDMATIEREAEAWAIAVVEANVARMKRLRVHTPDAESAELQRVFDKLKSGRAEIDFLNARDGIRSSVLHSLRHTDVAVTSEVVSALPYSVLLEWYETIASLTFPASATAAAAARSADPNAQAPEDAPPGQQTAEPTTSSPLPTNEASDSPSSASSS